MNLWTHSFALAYLYYDRLSGRKSALYANLFTALAQPSLVKICGMSRLYRPFQYTAVRIKIPPINLFWRAAHYQLYIRPEMKAFVISSTRSDHTLKLWISFKLRFNAFPKALIYASRCGISRKTAVNCYLLSPWDSPSFPNLLRIAT